MAIVADRNGGAGAAFAAGALGSAVTSRRNVALMLLLAAILAAGIGIAILKPGAISNLFDRGSKALAQSAHAAAQSPVGQTLAALLDQRSPGERTAGELSNTKQRYTKLAHYAARPHQRALAKTQPGLPAPFVKALTVPPQEAIPAVVPAEGIAAPLVQASVPGDVVGAPPLIGGGIVGGGGGGGGGGGPTPPPVETPAVPEPSTWLTMILGFGLCALALRRQRAAARRVRFQSA